MMRDLSTRTEKTHKIMLLFRLSLGGSIRVVHAINNLMVTDKSSHLTPTDDYCQLEAVPVSLI